MHDLHLADQILKTVLSAAKENSLKKISHIEIELGDFIEHGEKITPENLQYNFSLLAKDTPAENARLKIDSISGQNWRLKEITGQ